MAIFKVISAKEKGQTTRFIPIESVEYIESNGGSGKLYLTSEDEPIDVKLSDNYATWDDLLLDAYNAEFRQIIDLTSGR